MHGHAVPRETLILQHAWMVRVAGLRWGRYGLEIDDVRQEAFVAIVVAADTYDPRRAKFSTHAFWCIRGAMKQLTQRELRFHQPTMVTSDGQTFRTRMVRLDEIVGDDPDSQTRLELVSGNDPTPEQTVAMQELREAALMALQLAARQTARREPMTRRARRRDVLRLAGLLM